MSGNLSSSGSGSGNLSDVRFSDDDLPTDLQEAAIREKKLRIRIKELMEALESLSKNSETRHTQTAEYVSDLKRANGALVAAYEKAKKKHAARLRKLEQQMISVVERHDVQVRIGVGWGMPTLMSKVCECDSKKRGGVRRTAVRYNSHCEVGYDMKG